MSTQKESKMATSIQQVRDKGNRWMGTNILSKKFEVPIEKV